MCHGFDIGTKLSISRSDECIFQSNSSDTYLIAHFFLLSSLHQQKLFVSDDFSFLCVQWVSFNHFLVDWMNSQHNLPIKCLNSPWSWLNVMYSNPFPNKFVSQIFMALEMASFGSANVQSNVYFTKNISQNSRSADIWRRMRHQQTQILDFFFS